MWYPESEKSKDLKLSGGLTAYQKIHGKDAMPLTQEETMVKAEWNVRNALFPGHELRRLESD